MSQLSRRQLLHSGLGLSAVALMGGTLVGCSDSSQPSRGGGGGGGSPQAPGPAYKPLEGGPKPAIAGDETLPDTFLRYPDQPVVSVKTPPGDGKPVTVLTQTFAPVTPQPPSNTAWAQLNEKLGSELKLQQIPASEYATKFNTTVAGSQLPDMFFLAEVADLPDMVDATCLDLTDHLSGDAINAYPNLAAIPSAAWEAGRFNGRLYGLPSPRGAMSSGVLYRRDDLLKSKGADGAFGSFQEFFDLCKEINDPRGSRWALSMVPGQFIKNMLGVPNFWKFDGTTMQSWWTAPQLEQALEAQLKIAKAELMHPDAFAKPDTKTWFSSGKAYFNPDSFSAWAQYMAAAKPGLDIGVSEIPAFDGGGTGHLWLSFPSFGRSAINKNAADRVKVLLGVANYLAAPFGTQEYLDVKYGKEGEDYTKKSGAPQLTEQGASHVELGVKYLADAKQANFMPGHDDAARKLDKSIRALTKDAWGNDAVYLFSDTAQQYFEADGKKFSSLESDIVQGRKPVSAWRPAADEWWKSHGQKMADELTQAYHDAGRG